MLVEGDGEELDVEERSIPADVTMRMTHGTESSHHLQKRRSSSVLVAGDGEEEEKEEGKHKEEEIVVLRKSSSASSEAAKRTADVSAPPVSLSLLLGSLKTKLVLSVSWICMFSILGCYIRIVLQDATPPSFTSYLSSQFVGSFILGVAAETRRYWWEPLYIGVTIGLCGSITTFSSWQVDAAENVGFPGTPSSASDRLYNWVSIQVVGIAVPLCALRFGKHLGQVLMLYFESVLVDWDANADPGWSLSSAGITFALLVLVACAIALGAGYLPSSLTFSLLLASPLRYFLALGFNSPNRDRFPLGTFMANVFGSIVLAAVVIGEFKSNPLSPLACAALLAVDFGFCGCLTTISTFVNEISTLDKKMAYIYGWTSIIVTQVCLLIMLGVSISTGSTNPVPVC